MGKKDVELVRCGGGRRRTSGEGQVVDHIRRLPVRAGGGPRFAFGAATLAANGTALLVLGSGAGGDVREGCCHDMQRIEQCARRGGLWDRWRVVVTTRMRATSVDILRLNHQLRVPRVFRVCSAATTVSSTFCMHSLKSRCYHEEPAQPSMQPPLLQL